MPAEMLADAYGYENQMSNLGVYKGLVSYIVTHDRTPTGEQCM